MFLLLASVVLKFVRRSAPARWSFLFVLSIYLSILSARSVEIVDILPLWFIRGSSGVSYNIIRRSASKAPVNCAATPDALKERHSYVFQSEILLLGSDKVTTALPQHSWYNTSRTSVVMYWKLGRYDIRSERIGWIYYRCIRAVSFLLDCSFLHGMLCYRLL